MPLNDYEQGVMFYIFEEQLPEDASEECKRGYEEQREKEE